ncbi:TonB family protein [Spirosoma soli]|uniref:TonB family protein n=1 Tax=Spirosoma soli TaxID=1770529 RepID=A0ABW5M9E7_9BACT
MNPFLFLLTLLVCTSAFAQEPIYKEFDVDSAAQPRGGMSYLNTFLQANLRKPLLAEAKGVSGRVIVSGVVEPDGHVTDATIMQSLRPDCDREALRVFKLFNAWQPAQKGGHPVRQLIVIPVMFRPNPPFSYVNGARVSYFDADSKPLADSSEQALYKQLMPLDTNGIPNGDLIVYQRKHSNWKEYNRLPFARQKDWQRSSSGKQLYLVGFQNAIKLWQNEVLTVDEAGTIFRRTYYDNGRPTGSGITYHANGAVADRKEENEGMNSVTSWYPNGQIRKIWASYPAKPLMPASPERVLAFWDSTGHQLVVEGSGRLTSSTSVKSYADTTQKTTYIEQGVYENGLKQGTWTGRYTDGSYFYEEQYEKGVCQNGKAQKNGGDTLRYIAVEQQPEFPGGMQGLGQFLAQNLRYPAEAQRGGIQGQVFISFVVCTDGTLCDYEVLKGLDSSINQEALRVVKAMSGKWKPGMQRGQKVRVKYNMPINFTLQ